MLLNKEVVIGVDKGTSPRLDIKGSFDLSIMDDSKHNEFIDRRIVLQNDHRKTTLDIFNV